MGLSSIKGKVQRRGLLIYKFFIILSYFLFLPQVFYTHTHTHIYSLCILSYTPGWIMVLSFLNLKVVAQFSKNAICRSCSFSLWHSHHHHLNYFLFLVCFGGTWFLGQGYCWKLVQCLPEFLGYN